MFLSPRNVRIPDIARRACINLTETPNRIALHSTRLVLHITELHGRTVALDIV